VAWWAPSWPVPSPLRGGLGTLGLFPPADLRKAVRQVRDAAADRSVAGTRFLLTDEARAHPEYQRRILAADKMFRTTLFGLGWNSPLPMFSPIAPTIGMPDSVVERAALYAGETVLRMTSVISARQAVTDLAPR
jgi:nitronate monooxygenase